MTQWLILIIVAFTVGTQAAEVSQEGVEKISIFGAELQVEISTDKNLPGVLLWTGPGEGDYQIEKLGNELILRAKSSSSALLNVKIQSLREQKISLAATELTVRAQDSVGSLSLSARKLQGQVAKGRGSLQIDSPRGQFSVQGFNGDITLEAYQLGFVIKESVGNLDIYNFSGDSQIEKHTGRIKLRQQSGSSRIAKAQGSFSAELGRANLNLTEFSGRVDVESKESQIALNLSGDPEVDVRAKSGKVNVQLASGNVWLNLQTLSGEVYAPSPLKPFRAGKFKYIKGRTPGAGRGQVIVRTDDASVFVK